MAIARNDPYLGFNFIIEIENSALGGFSEASGLTQDTDIVPYREGADLQMNVRQLMGLRKYNNITLKRGYTTSRTLWLWRLNIINGIADRRNGSVVLRDELRSRVVEWHFEQGWINKYEGPALNAKGNDVAIESIEIVHEGLRIIG
jgi:phage tail-like protein